MALGEWNKNMNFHSLTHFILIAIYEFIMARACMTYWGRGREGVKPNVTSQWLTFGLTKPRRKL